MTGTIESIVRDNPLSNTAAVSGWIRLQSSHGMTPRLDDVVFLRTLTKPPFRERVERYLVTAVADLRTLNSDLNPQAEHLIGASYSDEREISVIMSYLQAKGYLQRKGNAGPWRITAEGHIAADELGSRRAQSTQGFVAMWFDPKMDEARDQGLRPAIEAAGYSPLVISEIEHTGKIDDRIIAEIRRSAFVVADFTGHRGGVYFEAGFAMGLNLPVMWTCRQDQMKELHFDIRQYNCIDWTEIPELRERLQKRIEARLGAGPLAQTQRSE
jgi:nucleoside 2-deoxyribosyltransferase